MPTRENPSGISLVLLAAGAGVAYYYWKKKKAQQAAIGEAQLGLQMLSEAVDSGEIVQVSPTAARDAAQATTDKWTRVRAAEAAEAQARAEYEQPQNWFEEGVDWVAPGLHLEIGLR